MGSVLPIVLTFGAIYALVPVLIILILIAAAAGLTRGYDILKIFGIGTLAGVAGTGLSGRGSMIGKTSLSKAAVKAKGAGRIFGVQAGRLAKPAVGRLAGRSTRVNASKNEKEAMWSRVLTQRGTYKKPGPGVGARLRGSLSNVQQKMGPAGRVLGGAGKVTGGMVKMAISGGKFEKKIGKGTLTIKHGGSLPVGRTILGGVATAVGAEMGYGSQEAKVPPKRSAIKAEKDNLAARYYTLETLKTLPGISVQQQQEMAAEQKRIADKFARDKGLARALDLAEKQAAADTTMTKREFFENINKIYDTYYGTSSQQRLMKDVLGATAYGIARDSVKRKYYQAEAKEEFLRSSRDVVKAYHTARALPEVGLSAAQMGAAKVTGDATAYNNARLKLIDEVGKLRDKYARENKKAPGA